MEAEQERLEASSVHASHEYHVQEADLGDEVEAELERLETYSVHAFHVYHVQEADLGDEVEAEPERLDSAGGLFGSCFS